jgi:hypothetical protein
MSFYPEHASVPSELKTEEFVVRPLRATDVELDYDALMASKEELWLAEEDGWPSEDFTLAENLEDLQTHEKEHIERTAFTFTIMNPTESECLGCLYIQPLAPVLNYMREHKIDTTAMDDYSAIVTFWVRSSRLVNHLDRRLLGALLPWFERDWAFSGVAFGTNSRVKNQVDNFNAAGLRQLYANVMPDKEGKELIYG